MARRAGWMACVCMMALTSAARAAVINGGFETGNTSGWTGIGATHADTSAIGVSVPHGTYMGYIDNTGNFAASGAAVATSLGVSGPTIIGLGQGTPTTGSALSQDITVAAGDVLSFDWNFLTDEWNEAPSFNDFAMFTISSAAYFLASRGSTHATLNLTSPPAGFDGQTGWMSASHTFASAGTYKIGFAIFNVGDSGHNSVLLLDGVDVSVPEPVGATVLVLATAGIVRRHRKSARTRP